MALYWEDNEPKMTREEVFTHLAKQGFITVVVNFSGGNDEGGADSITGFKGDGSTENLMTSHSAFWRNEEKGGKYVVWKDGDYRDATPEEIEQTRFSGALEEPVYSAYGSFAGAFHVSGKVIWNVPSRKVVMEKSESYESWHDSTEEV